jgi:hypothetical protein
VNVSFVKLSMLSDLKFSEAVYGLGAGIFFIGYSAAIAHLPADEREHLDPLPGRPRPLVAPETRSSTMRLGMICR